MVICGLMLSQRNHRCAGCEVASASSEAKTAVYVYIWAYVMRKGTPGRREYEASGAGCMQLSYQDPVYVYLWTDVIKKGSQGGGNTKRRALVARRYILAMGIDGL